MSNIEIWQPRWMDRTVLIAKYKVGNDNYIKFTKTPSMPGTYHIKGDEVRKYPLQSNGKVACYCVPLDALELKED